MIIHRAVAPAALLAVFLLAGSAPPVAAQDDAWVFEAPERLLGDVSVPVDIAFARDGFVYIALLTAREIHRASVMTGRLDPGFKVELHQADWQLGSETGLFSIALAPDFHRSGVLYASYSRNESGEWQNVLSRLTLLDRAGSAEEEVLLVRPGGLWHNGGRVLIAGGFLWWTAGDTIPFYEWQEFARVVQEEGNLIGKTLRLTLDGEPAEGNPWGDHAYTKGHRNVFGIAWDPRGERALVTENGNAGTDYLYILEAGANYGWPDCEGPCPEPREEFTEPIWYSNGTVAPTGAAWFRAAFWWGSFNHGELYRTHQDEDGTWHNEAVYRYNGSGRHDMLAVAAHPDGRSIWFTTYDEVWRVPFAAHPDWRARDPLAGSPYWWEEQSAAAPQRPRETGGEPAAQASAPGAAVLGIVALAVAGAFGRWPRRNDRGDGQS